MAGPEGPLYEAYRAYTLEAAVREQQLAAGIIALRAAGIEPLLGKGHAAARYYAQRALRPYGDIDLFVSPGLRSRALKVLVGQGHPIPVDVHPGFAELGDRPEADLQSRAETLDVRGVAVRVFGAEDHLRFLALHLLRHGASRPTWLCDLAALVEVRGARLDWDLVFAGREREAQAVGCAIALAARLLGGEVEAVPPPAQQRLAAPPSWLEPAVLEQWGRGSGHRVPLADALWRPWRLLTALEGRWPNPVEATAGLGARFDERPRWPYQLAFAALRAARFARTRGRFDR